MSQEERLAHGVAKLAPLDRRILLLVSVENLPPDQVGRILGLDEAETRALLAKARLDLGRHTSASALIIEDEPIIAMELSQIVSDMGLTVAAAVAGQQQAVEAATQALSLVLADIQLEDEGSGLVAAREILQRYDVPVVFVTGFPERLLTGEGLEPAFVVAKPFTEAALKATIAHALDLYDAPENAAEHKKRLLAKLQQVTTRELRQQGAKPA
jgi:CheY-like chemotaxis protein